MADPMPKNEEIPIINKTLWRAKISTPNPANVDQAATHKAAGAYAVRIEGANSWRVSWKIA